MATYYSNDFRAGLKIMLDGEPYAVEASEFVKPGKGQAFARVKLRRLLTGTRVEKTFKSTDSAEGADVVDMSLTYLYNDGEFWHFMNTKLSSSCLLMQKQLATTRNGCWIRQSVS